MRSRAAFILSFALGVLLLASGGYARAAGVTRVQQNDGSVQTYQDVRMSLHDKTLRIASSDHQGVLEIVSDACSFVSEVERCLPYNMILHQHKQTHQIAVVHGTVYINATDAMEMLPRSSRQLAAHSVLVSMRTLRGTYVSIEGVLDEVTR